MGVLEFSKRVLFKEKEEIWMIKKISFVMIVLFVFSFVGVVSAAEVPIIGFSQCTLQSPFYVSLMRAAQEKAQEMGAELIYTDAQDDIIKQNSDVMDLITRGIDVLLLNPVNAGGVAPALRAAEEAGIPVITVDRPVGEQRAKVFVGRTNYDMGKLAGQVAVELLGGPGEAKGKVIEIQGAAGDQVMMDRRDGFHSIVEKEKGIEIIQSPYCYYIRSNAISAFQDLIQTHPDVKLVYAHNDDMALGAVQVLRQNDLLDDVFVVGIDGLMEAIKAIIDGEMDATVLNDPQYLGELAVEVALGVLAGKDYPEFVDAGTALVTIENAADYYNEDLTFARYTPEK